mmetsp:Transcript_33406/g.51259  ORF Transcript_33406/g.51259 Transcript_33406/m.51259 type:complete len:113 (+) Transcript_33406:835-1173(+)
MHQPKIAQQVRVIYDDEANEGIEDWLTRKCPKCREWIAKEKYEPNYIVCPNCQLHWCWVCNCALYTKQHFNPINFFGCPSFLNAHHHFLVDFLLRFFLTFLLMPLGIAFVPL